MSLGPGGPPPLFTPIAPDKGSFPIDREGVCKKQLIDYFKCLRVNKAVAEFCREETKEYLVCRMNNNLMDKEEPKKLGLEN